MAILKKDSLKKELLEVEVKSRNALRKWLLKNHERSESVWIITYKKSSPELYLPYSELVDECLCFGWIDSLPRKVDEERTKHLISPRSARSNWSAVNKKKVSALTKSGLMHTAGQLVVEKAKKSGTWTALDKASILELPVDLIKELKAHGSALAYFEAFPPSTKRGILEWIGNAKRPETRTKRCQETAHAASKNERVLNWKAKRNSSGK